MSKTNEKTQTTDAPRILPVVEPHSEIYTEESKAAVKEGTFSLENLMETHKTKSAVIRHLTAQGWSRGAIAKFMGIRYQHVRNVLMTPLKGQ